MTARPLLLTGIRILECTATVAGAYCAKLLADLGAEVIKLEPPEGDPLRRRGPFPGDRPHPERSGLFLYLNTNKRSRVLNLDSAAAAPELDALLHWAGLLIEDFQSGRTAPALLEHERQRLVNPNLVRVSVTPFGRTGPYRNRRGSELVDFHMSGLGYLTPGNVVDPEEPPLKGPGFMAEQLAGLTAAVAALSASMLAERTGAAHDVDISALEASVAMMLLNVPWLPYEGQVPSRMRAERRGIPIELMACADGYFTVLMVEPAQWQAWVELMGNPEWAADPALRDRAVRAEHWDQIKQRILDWAQRRSKGEIAAQGQARAVPVFPVNTVSDLFACPQLAHRGFLTSIKHLEAGSLRYPGLPYHFDGPPSAEWQAAPLLGNDQASALPAWSQQARHAPKEQRERLPLGGVRVADFSWVLAGPHCTQWLAALGADVIRVETHRRLDQFRRSPPYADGITDPERAGSFHAINFGKRGITLDLTQTEGQSLARELIAVSDVVVENFAHGQMERFGLSVDTVRAIRPDVVMASSSGLGRTGPLREYVAYGNTIHAYAGLSALVGHPGGPPRGISTTYTDPLTGAAQCLAILAALNYREESGRGCTIDLSMAEATMTLLPEALLDYDMNGRVAEPAGNDDPQQAPHGVYRCKGVDRWVAVAVASDEAWARFCDVIGQPEWRDEQRYATARARVVHRAELDRLVTAWTSCRTSLEVTEILQGAGIAAGPSNTVADLLDDPHLRERGFFVTPAHPLTGVRPLPGIPWHFTPGLKNPVLPAPLLGQHNGAVFIDLLGMTPAAVQKFELEKVIH